MNKETNGREDFRKLNFKAETERWFEKVLRLLYKFNFCKDWIFVFVETPL